MPERDMMRLPDPASAVQANQTPSTTDLAAR